MRTIGPVNGRELAARFAPLTLQKPLLTRAQTAGIPAHEWNSIHWIKPVLLGEVAFTEWTQEGRIRHPSFQGLREDKNAVEVEKETPHAVTRAKSRRSSN